MALIDGIRQKLGSDRFELSRHAVDQSIRRNVSVREIREAIGSGEIIEEYPEDKYWPSYLIYGRTKSDHCTYNVVTRRESWSRT
jgi:hypothetical protein